MRSAVIAAFAATLLVAGAFGRDLADDVVREPLEAAGRGEAGAFDFSHSNPVKEIWVTADNQILVELKDDEDTRPNLFDLNGRTLVFTPDGRGGYSRRVRALEWEEEIGEEVQTYSDSRPVIRLEGFGFPFAGRRWDSFYLGPPGVVTFGAPFTFSIPTLTITMQEIADRFISGPTLSALYRPLRYAATHVVHGPDRVVVTWLSGDSSTWPHGVREEKPARFQAVLGADGSIRFNYIDVPFEDGIAGLFQEEGPLAGVDLSRSDSRVSNLQHEVFHFRTFPNRQEVVCHLLRTLGDEFDLFVFHTENRTDKLRTSTSWGGGRCLQIRRLHPGTLQGQLDHTRLDKVQRRVRCGSHLRIQRRIRLRLVVVRPRIRPPLARLLFLRKVRPARTALQRQLRVPLAGRSSPARCISMARGQDPARVRGRPQFDHGRQLLGRSR